MGGVERGSAAEEQPIRITADMLDVPRPVDTRIDFEQGMTYATATRIMIRARAAFAGRSTRACEKGEIIARVHSFATGYCRRMVGVFPPPCPRQSQHLIGNVFTRHLHGL